MLGRVAPSNCRSKWTMRNHSKAATKLLGGAEYLANVEELLIAATPNKAAHDPGQPLIPGDSATQSDDWSVAPVEEDWYDLILGQY